MVVRGLPGMDDDEQARYVEASFGGADGGEARIASIYLPNGNPTGTDKFTYKIAWMERLVGHAQDLLRREIPFVLAGTTTSARPTKTCTIRSPGAMMLCAASNRGRGSAR